MSINKIESQNGYALKSETSTPKQILLGIRPQSAVKPKPLVKSKPVSKHKRKKKKPNIIGKNIEGVEILTLYNDGGYTYENNINGILVVSEDAETQKDKDTLDSENHKKRNKPEHINVIPIDKKTKKKGTVPDYTNTPVEEVVSEILSNNKTTPENIPADTEEKSAILASNTAKTFTELAKKVGFGGKNNKEISKIYDDIYKKSFDDIKQKLSYGVSEKRFNQLKKKKTMSRLTHINHHANYSNTQV